MIKRALDIIMAIIGLLMLLPVMLLCCILIRLNSKGSPVFAQTRLGRHQTPFTCYKLRTMALGTKQAGTHEVQSASVTSVGRVLRAVKLDEVPQLWNVIKGEMSLVGPRPGLPVQQELTLAREANGVFAVRPGITGLSQIQQIDMSTPQRLAEMDAQYIQMQSLWLDICIITATITGKGMGDKVV